MDLTDGAGNVGVGNGTQCAYSVHERRTLEEEGNDIRRNSSGLWEQDVEFQSEFAGEGAQHVLRGPLHVALDHREPGGRRTEPSREGADGVAARVVTGALEPGAAQGSAEGTGNSHNCKLHSLHFSVKW